MIDPSAWLQGYLEVGRQGAGLFILWWAIGGGFVLLLAETTYQFVSTRNVAFQSYIWRSAALAVFLLPLSLLISPVQMHLPISSETVLGETSPIQTPPLVRVQTTPPAQKSIDNSPMKASLPEKTREESEPMLAAQNGGGEERPILEASQSNPSSNGHDPFWMAAWIAYGLGVFVGLAFCLWSYLRIRFFLRSTETCAQPSIRQAVEEVSQEMGMQTPIEIRRCESHASPAMLGGWKPTLILPGVLLDEWEVQDVKPILYHELCHLAQWDHFYDQIQRFLRIALWFFPGVYWLGKRLEEAREKYCDAQAMHRCGDADCYANLIIRLAEDMSSLTPQPTFPMARNGKHALRRFQWILSNKEKLVMINKPLNRWITGMLLAFVIVVIGGINLSASSSSSSSSNMESDSSDGSSMTLRLVSRSNEQPRHLISPNGLFEVFLDFDTGDLMLLEKGTSEIRNLTKKGSYSKPAHYLSSWPPLFSHDSQYIAYEWFNGDKEAVEFHVVDANGEKDRTLIIDRDFEEIVPLDWSLNQEQIVFMIKQKEENELLVINVEDNTQTLIKSLGMGFSKAAYFSPDGKYIAFDHSPSEKQSSCDISLYNVEEGIEIPLIKNHGKDVLLGWSPNGEWIVYANDASGSTDINVLPVYEGEIQGPSQFIKKEMGNITPQGIRNDGSFYYQIIYENTTLYTADFDYKTGKFLSDPQEVITASQGYDISWSPNGEYLAFYQNQSSDSQILCLWSESTGEVRNINLPEGTFYSVEWSPDCQSILVVKNHSEIYRVNINTGRMDRVIERKESDNDRKWIGRGYWLADGKSILLTRSKFPYLSSKGYTFVLYNTEDQSEKDLLQPEKVLLNYVMSPDRKCLAYNTYDFNGSFSLFGELNIISPPDSESHVVFEKIPFPQVSSVLTWTHDGEALLYVDGYNLMQVNAKEKNVSPQKVRILDRIPKSWSFHPDGKKIAYACEGKTRYEMWALENFLPKKSVRKTDRASRIHQAFLEAKTNQTSEESLRISDTLIEDDFNDGDLDGWVAFVVKSSNPPYEHFVKDGELVLTNAGISIGRSDWTNYSVRFRFCIKSIIGHFSGLILSSRCSKRGDMAFCCFSLNEKIEAVQGFNNPEGNYIVEVLDVKNNINFELDQWYEIRTDVMGKNRKGYLDGQLMFDVNSEQHPQGYVSIKSNGKALIDDISIRLIE